MRALLAALILCAFANAPAHARQHHHRAHHRHHHHWTARRHHALHYASRGLERVRLADGQVITIASAYADRFVGFLNALFAREGHLPHVGCFAAHGHMRNSLHHWGGACDVGQRARNVAWRPMYHVAALAREFGLTDGCSWRHPDCGHVDVSGSVRRGRAAFASVRRHAAH